MTAYTGHPAASAACDLAAAGADDVVAPAPQRPARRGVRAAAARVAHAGVLAARRTHHTFLTFPSRKRFGAQGQRKGRGTRNEGTAIGKPEIETSSDCRKGRPAAMAVASSVVVTSSVGDGERAYIRS